MRIFKKTHQPQPESDQAVRAAFWRLEQEKQDPDAAHWRDAHKLL